MVEGDDLAVDQHVGERAALPGDRSELVGPVQPLAGLQRGLATLDAQLHPVAIEFDLMAPSIAGGRTVDQTTELRRDEIRQRRYLAAFGGFRRGARRGGLPVARPRLGGIAPVRIPYRVGPAAAGFRRHERLWGLALAFRDLGHRPTRSDGLIGIENAVGAAFPREIVAMLDEKPVGALAAVAVVAHPDQHPASMQLLAMQRELQIALLESPFRIVGFPIAAVPELHRAAAILPLGDGAFEIAVIQRMIFHLDRQPLVVGIERGAARHRPRLEHAVKLQPEVIMQPGRIVLLNHEAPLF